MRTWLSLMAVLVLVVCSSCKTHLKNDVDTYPGGSVLGMGGNVERPEGTLFRIKQVAGDGPRTVAEHFRKTLVEGKGWTEESGAGFIFRQGKMRVPSVTDFTDPNIGPEDPNEAAGYVLVAEASNQTYIYILRYVPKPKK
ncbi:MAG: hypothetical protein QM765_33380 [Myxococcales bacterium]